MVAHFAVWILWHHKERNLRELLWEKWNIRSKQIKFCYSMAFEYSYSVKELSVKQSNCPSFLYSATSVNVSYYAIPIPDDVHFICENTNIWRQRLNLKLPVLMEWIIISNLFEFENLNRFFSFHFPGNRFNQMFVSDISRIYKTHMPGLHT